MDQSPDSNDAAAGSPPGGGGSRGSTAAVLTFFALALIGLLAVQFFWPAHNAESNLLAVGDRLPDLHLEPLTGKSRALRLQDLAGKVVLLDFWGTWCPPCQAEFPHIAEFATEYRDRPDFEVLAVSCGSDDNDPRTLRPETEAFLRDRKLDLPTYFDPQYFTQLQIEKPTDLSFPTTLVLDRQSVVRGLWVGYRTGTEREIATVVSRLLGDAQKQTDKK